MNNKKITKGKMGRIRISIPILLLFSFFLYCPSVFAYPVEQEKIGQDTIIDPMIVINKDSINHSFIENDTLTNSSNIPVDTLTTPLYYQLDAPDLDIDTTKIINYWNITERTGEMITAYPDTFLTDYFNRTNVEGFSISEAYLGNLGLATESRIFFDRNDRSSFIFMDPFYRYAKSPGKFNFINTKIPHSNLSYQRAGSRQVMEERLQGLLAVNLGKKLNIGFDVDYLYARGYYNSQAAKHLEWVFFANYLSDRHRLHVFINPADYTLAENGGITDDLNITHPSGDNSLEFQTNLKDTWNNLKGGQYYLNYHYNLGFEKDTEYKDEEGKIIKQFIPVSSIIYTFNYDRKKKTFYSTDKATVDSYYSNKTDYLPELGLINDSTSYWNLSNTLGLSLREGFSEWAKFNLTAFITQDFRSYTMMSTGISNFEKNQSSTYIGGELAKNQGNIFRYNAQASFGILGYNLGDMNLSGKIDTRIPVWGDTASISAYGFIKNLAPTFYENNYHSKYFWWNEDFSKTKKVRIGGIISIPHTNTNFNLGVENITDYIYFNKDGLPTQHTSNIQVLSAELKQNFQFHALHWDNQLVYQKSSDNTILPLPDFAAYTSLYIQFKIAKVLTIQMGANAHYWTKYYAPSYEPAIQQFKLQDMNNNPVKVGNYPLLSGFLNCHLKQTRFFIQYYNAGSQFINPPEYFSLPHYPVNPAIVKLGLSIDFIN